MSFPIATVICLCYNQERFVPEAIHSVIGQSYPNVELIIVDDASTDDSVRVIRNCIASYPDIRFISLTKNSGNCAAFNRGLAFARGEFIIDLAADDVLLPSRVAEGVRALQAAGERFGVNFSDADWVAEDGAKLYSHSDRFPHETIPTGNIYKDLIARFFICSPTMIFKREVIGKLGGYDESLTYEDFDFWIRSSRDFFYCYTPSVQVRKRVVRNSMSHKQFRILSPQLKSTFRVCEKILQLNVSQQEQAALAKRIRYEMKLCLRLLAIPLAIRYAGLYVKNARRRYPAIP